MPGANYLITIKEKLGVNINWLLTGEGEPFPRRSDAPPQALDAYTLPRRHPMTIMERDEEHGSAYTDLPDPGPCDPSEFDLVPMSEAQLSAGSGNFVISEKVKTYYAFRKDWIRRVAASPRRLIMMEVQGGSMEPTICAGDVVLIDLNRTHIHSGQIYALRINDTIMIKRLEPLVGGLIRVISDNKREYPPYDAERSAVRVIGQVIWYARELVPRD